MARHRAPVSDLAREAGLELDEALLILMEAGFSVEENDCTISKKWMSRARSALALPRRPDHALRCDVAALARRASLQESDVREALFRAGLLKKRRLKRLPRDLLGRGEIALGLVKVGRAEVRGRDSIENGTSGLTEHLGSPTLTRRELLKARRDWPTIGPTQPLTYLAPADVKEIHWVLVDDFRKSKDPIDPPGVRADALLEAAAHRPRTSLGRVDKYPSVAMAGGSLMHSLVLDHPFHNGNKRTALVSLLVFLDKNGWVLTSDQDAIYDLLLRLADHRVVDAPTREASLADREFLKIAEWLQGNIRRVRLGEYPLQFRQLRAILLGCGCTMEHPRGVGNRMNISRGKLHTQVGYRNEGGDVDRNAIHKVRKDLALDEEHGFDSDIFYNQGPRIPEFINKYRRVLDRLAKD